MTTNLSIAARPHRPVHGVTRVILDAARHVLATREQKVTALPGTPEARREELSELIVAGQVDRRTQIAWAAADVACDRPVLAPVTEHRVSRQDPLPLAI